MNSLISPTISRTLDRLHGEADKELPKILKGLSKGLFRKLQPEDMADTYIAMNRTQGRLLYQLIRATRARHIVEFGSSFGISTLYLAAAAQDNGGQVTSTEILPNKAATARQNFREAGVDHLIDLRLGNALETLLDIPPGIDFLLLDGWNDLYLPLLHILEPKFTSGASILTDNAGMASAKPFLEYIRTHPNYVSSPLKTSKGITEFSTYHPHTI